MFNLDQAIADWRRELAAEGIQAAEVLDELESHLRDDVEERVRSGLSDERAFGAAVRQIGRASLLEGEFDKVGRKQEAPARVKQALLTLAGIPHHYLDEPMNTTGSNAEPRWATYLKAVGFLTPAVFLWSVASVFAVPKLQTLCRDANLPDSGAFWSLTHSNFMITLFFREYGLWMAGAILLMAFLLEWRSSRWPRYRRATVGFGAFLLNSVVLLSLFMMFITALVAVPALLPQGR